MEKVMTKCGLMFMSKEERENWLDALMTDNVIHPDKVAELIDASKEIINGLTFRETKAVTEEEKDNIRWLLKRINGKDVVRKMKPDELADWVADLRENGTDFSPSDLGVVAKALMSGKE
ncbi:MAG: hypothetical protein IJ088_14655 [Clostridia bacterium]|nr:hypothetical protein [Clostridia bacterium]